MRDRLPITPQVPGLPAIAARLAAYAARVVPGSRFMRRAAVAVVLAEREGEPALLLIKRATHVGDPWSGHMAFPGGRVDRGDLDPRAAALREVREEIGLDLAQVGRPRGELSELLAMAHGRPRPMVVSPFVYELDGGPPALAALTLNHEVDEVVWVPLSFFARRANRREMAWRIADTAVPMPCYRWDGRVVWGLTLEMIDELVALVLGLRYEGRRKRFVRMARILWTRWRRGRRGVWRGRGWR